MGKVEQQVTAEEWKEALDRLCDARKALIDVAELFLRHNRWRRHARPGGLPRWTLTSTVDRLLKAARILGVALVDARSYLVEGMPETANELQETFSRNEFC